MVLRIATPDDMAPIAALHIFSWQENYRGILSDTYLDHDIHQDRNHLWQQRFASPEPQQIVLVACKGDTVCGFICIYLDNHPEWGTLVENLHISRHHQGKGLGKQLLFSAAKLSYAQHPTKGMYLEVLADNVAAQTFYQQLGALKTKTQVWQAPDGCPVYEFVYRWKSIENLILA